MKKFSETAMRENDVFFLVSSGFQIRFQARFGGTALRALVAGGSYAQSASSLRKAIAVSGSHAGVQVEGRRRRESC